MTTIIEFEDNGQDFLEWTLDEDQKVIECTPFQFWAWGGSKVLNTKISPGCELEIETTFGEYMVLKHQVKAVHTNP